MNYTQTNAIYQYYYCGCKVFFVTLLDNQYLISEKTNDRYQDQ